MVSSAAHWRSVLAEVDQVGSVLAPGPTPGHHAWTARPGSWPRARSSSPARTAGPPSARRAPASTRPTPGSWWPPGSAAAREWTPRVVEHPQLFVTLTAPSFGPVHSGPSSAGVSRVCRPRRDAHLSPRVGRSSCRAPPRAPTPSSSATRCARECFDYRGAVLWNAHVPRLWERTSPSPLPPGRHRRRRSSSAELRTVGPALLHEGGRVPAPGSGPPPRRAPGRRGRGAGRTPAVVARRRRARTQPSGGPSRAPTSPCRASRGHAAPGPLGHPDRRPRSSSRPTPPTPSPSPPTWPSTPPRRPTARRGWPIGSARRPRSSTSSSDPTSSRWSARRGRWAAAASSADLAPAGPCPRPRLRGAVLLQERPLLDHVQGAASGPGRSTPGARPRTRSTSTASGASPAGATPTPRPICWPGGSTKRPAEVPNRVPEVFPDQCPSP